MKTLHLSKKSLVLVALIGMYFPLNAQNCVPQGDQVSYGTNNSWIGYMYQGTSFEVYKGSITRGGLSGIFDENFGTEKGTFATSGCSIITEQFSARFRLQKIFSAGTYTITVGGEGGYRLSFNGGATWAINHWNDQVYNTTTASIYLKGTYDMVLEYYSNKGGNRISYSVSTNLLPLTLKNWSASLQAPKKVRMSWACDAVIDFDHFIVQRSTDGANFTAIQTINNKNNNSNVTYAYEYTDTQVPDGVVYYRLVMVDKDGTLRYSDIETISAKMTNQIKVFPTVVNNKQITIRSDKTIANGRIEIIAQNGQLVQSEKWDSKSLSKQLILKNNLVSAPYYVKITDDEGTAEIRKIIVQQ